MKIFWSRNTQECLALASFSLKCDQNSYLDTSVLKVKMPLLKTKQKTDKYVCSKCSLKCKYVW